MGWGQSSVCFSPVYAQSRGCAKHVGEKRAISQLTELGLFHAQLRWLPRDCRYTQLVSLGCYVFLVQFPEEMRLMCSYWVCVGVGTWACVCLSLQASPLEILNPLIAFNPIWQNTGGMNFQQVQWNGQLWKGKLLWVPSIKKAATEQEHHLLNTRDSIWECTKDNLPMYHTCEKLGPDPALS